LSFWEKYYIKEWNTKVPRGYNLTDGGDGIVTPSSETIALMRNAKLGKKQSADSVAKRSGKNSVFYGKRGVNSHNYGRIVSLETRSKLRLAFSGKNNPNYMKPVSKERREKISASKLGSKSKKATSRYFGVSLKSRNKTNPWFAYVEVNRKYISLGYYDSEEKAAHAYDRYVMENSIPRPMNF
jgi:hypothetical protein